MKPGRQATAVDGDLIIPSSLSQPIKLVHDGQQVSVRLKGSSGGRDEVQDAGAQFEDALTGVDVSYVATPTGIKETLALAGASAPKSFDYDLRAGSDWSAAVDGRGNVVLRDFDGEERYRISAPLAWDSAPDPAYTNALTLTVNKVSDGRWTVSLRPDESWLTDPARVAPIFIDPDYSWANGTTHFHGATDCYLASVSQSNTTFCAQTYLQTGYFNREYRTILKWGIASAIPSNATVSAATFKAYAPPASARASGNHRLSTITSDWDSTATWNNRKPGTPWTTAGGDISTNANYTSSSPTAVQALSTWFTFPAPLAAVQGWVNGTLPNYGFLLKTDAGAPANQAYAWASTEASTSSSFPATSNEWPTLDVTWVSGDQTAPPVPSDIVPAPLVAATSSVTTTLTCPDDVAVAGAPTSGTVKCQYRYGKDGGTVGNWTDVPLSGEFTIAGLVASDTLQIQAKSIDNAGNQSGVATHSGSVTATPFFDEEEATVTQLLTAQFGMTSTQATTWLEREQSAIANRRVLTAGAEGYFAGLWFDNATRRVRYQVKAGAPNDRIQHAFDLAGISPSGYAIETVIDDEQELRSQVASISQSLSDLIQSKLVRVWPIQAGPSINIALSSSANSLEVTRVQAAATQATVPTTVTTAAPSELTAVPALGGQCTIRGEPLDDDAHTLNTGDRLAFVVNGHAQHDNGRCRVIRSGAQFDLRSQTLESRSQACGTAFVADGIPPDTRSYVLTAGHCVGGSGLTPGDRNAWLSPDRA